MLLAFDRHAGGYMTPSHDGLRQMVEQNDEKAEAGHGRLRKDLRELEEQVDKGLQSLRDSHAELRMKIATMETTPVDAGKLVMNPRVVATIVAMSLSIAGGMWASTSGLREGQRDVLARMDAQKTALDNTREVQNLQWSQLRADVDEIKKQQKLQQLDTQDLREKILTRGVK